MTTTHLYIESVVKGSPEDESVIRQLMPHVRKRVIEHANKARKDYLERKRLRAPAPRLVRSQPVKRATSAKSGIKPVKPARGKGPKIVS